MKSNIFLIVVVKNESFHLKNFCEYHISLGFKKIVIVNDGGESEYIEKIVDFFGRVFVDFYRLEEISYYPELFGFDSRERFSINMDIRKRIIVHNILNHLESIYKQGYLICLDADERIKLPKSVPSLNDLDVFKNNKFPFVRLWVSEYIYGSEEMWGRQIFKSYPRCVRYVHKFLGLLSRKLLPDSHKDLLGYIFSRAISLGISPSSFKCFQKMCRPQLFQGYDSFKEFARFPLETVGTFNIHRWTHCGRRFTDPNFGILHYDYLTINLIIDKFSKRDVNGAFSGNVLRNVIASLARDGDIRQLEAVMGRFTININSVRFRLLKLIGWFTVR